MKNKVFKQICFFTILLILVFVFNRVLVPKDENYDKYKIFNNLEKNSLDICYIGTSIPDAAIDPEIINKKNAVESFNYSITGLRLEHMYYRIVDMLKTQKPSLLVLDTSTFLPMEEGAIDLLVRWAFNPLPLSKNKYEAISKWIPASLRINYISNYPLYHTRIFELNKNDWLKALNLYEYPEKAAYKGISNLGWKNLGTDGLDRSDDFFLTDFSKVTEEIEISNEQKEYLELIIELARENDIKILFLTVPYKDTYGYSAERNVKINNYISSNYLDSDVKLLDMNRMYQEIDFDYCYMVDEGHMNSFGASLVSNYLADYINENYDFN